MSSAQFKVSFAGPLVSFQDAGRFAALRFGVPWSGPMDRFAHKAANTILKQAQTNTAIEVSLGGLVLDCIAGEVTVAVAGGAFSSQLGDTILGGWGAATIRAGDKITIRAGNWGSWCYLAFAGDLNAPQWLGSTATHTLSGIGGGSLKSGDVFEVQDASVLSAQEGPRSCPDLAKPTGSTRVVMGPQEHHFDPKTVESLTTSEFALTDAFDRMGVRLTGPEMILKDALSIPSEPVLRGALQVSGEGVPTILLADHQTSGGYPKIATILSSDVDRVTQLRAGDALRFESVTPEQAVDAARAHHAASLQALADVIRPDASLEERLRSENLISGVVKD